MMPGLSLNLHLKLLLPALLGAIPALFALLLLGKAYHHEALLQTEQTLLIQSQRLAERHQAVIDQTQYLLGVLAASPALQAMENPACETRLAEMYHPVRDTLANLLVIRPDGQVACNAKAPGKHHSLSERLYYQRAMSTGAFAVGEYTVGKTTRTPVLGMAYPLVRDGQVVMLTATSIELGMLSEGARLALHGQESHLIVVDRQGRVLLSPNAEGAFSAFGSSLSETPLGKRLLQGGPPTTFELPSPTGQPTLYAYAPLGPEREPYAYLALGLPSEALAKRYQVLEYIQIGGALLALVAGLFLASLALSNVLRQRLSRLITAVRQIRSGNIDAQAPTDRSHDELGELTTAFNDMASTLASQQSMLMHLAHHDPLTGQPNRLLFIERVEQAIRRAEKDRQKLALVFLDLDHFKTINDSLGHELGDRLLQAVALRLHEHLRGSDTLARMGGDEFTLLVEDVGEPHDVAHAAQRLLESFSTPFELEGNSLFITASAGIALYPRDGETAKILMQRADTALYKSKSEGRNTYHFFSDDMEQAAAERLRLEAGLRFALERLSTPDGERGNATGHGELTLHYQPQVRLCDGAWVGMEALARWHHPEWGWISPARFIPIAEDSGLIIRLGRWALREACLQFKAWRNEGRKLDYVAVNVSAVQMRFGCLNEDVRQVLHETGVAGHHLELEITESAILHAPEEAVRKLETLRTMGVRLSIDDFGTGYSSLSYLKRMPLNRIKIDQGFVRDMLTDPQDEAIVSAVLALGQSMELDVLAEGVETAEHVERLISLGCASAQGYYFSRPCAAADLKWRN
ncbi:MAG: EAL domain-containing protein [Pseudomonadota bacterium]